MLRICALTASGETDSSPARPTGIPASSQPGFGTLCLIAAVLCATAGLIAAAGIRRRAPAPAPG